MKNLILNLMIAVISSSVLVKPANAGMIFTMIVPYSVQNKCMNNTDILNARDVCDNKSGTLFYVGLGSIASGLALMAIPPVFTLGIIVVILDADGSLPKEEIEAILSEQYPFINDNEVIAELAEKIKLKASIQRPIDGKIEVRLSREDILSVIESTDLLETNRNKIEEMIKSLN